LRIASVEDAWCVMHVLAFELAVRVHKESLKLPKFELYEQGSQIRRASNSIRFSFNGICNTWQKNQQLYRLCW